MVAINDILQEDKELMGYQDSFIAFQEFLLEEENYNIGNLRAIENVSAFMMAGTKAKRKKNFKAYFADVDIVKAKELSNLLQILKIAVESKELESINKAKNELIMQGMLLLTKDYINLFTIEGLENEVIDTQNKSETKLGKLMILWKSVEFSIKNY